MKKIILNEKEYEVVENEKDCLNETELQEKATEYFDDFDYIFGDYSYDKLRLKGYYDSKNKKKNKINDYSTIDDYIKNYCQQGSNIFILKKIK